MFQVLKLFISQYNLGQSYMKQYIVMFCEGLFYINVYTSFALLTLSICTVFTYCFILILLKKQTSFRTTITRLRPISSLLLHHKASAFYNGNISYLEQALTDADGRAGK